MKFRIILQNKLDKRIEIDFVTLDELLNRNGYSYGVGWEIIAKDQFTGLEDKNKIEIYGNDIVKVYSDRLPMYKNAMQSKYDLQKIETRNIVVFQDYMWMLDTNTEWNKNILELKGRETDERSLKLNEDLHYYAFFQDNRWNIEHNSHCYWNDIEVIGNIHENPYLLNKEDICK